MVFYEMIVAVLLPVDLEASKSYAFLSRVISSAMLHDQQLKDLHEQRKIKGYNFCNLYPLEKDKVYKQGRAYVFHIRAFDQSFLLKLKHILPHIKMGVISAEIRTIAYHPLSRLKSLTPVIATVNNRSWTKEDGLKLLMERAHINALKKYRAWVGEMDEPTENFIAGIQLLNEKPIKIPYKSNSFLGSKVILDVKSDSVSQQLAFAAIGAGLLEKNSIGMGYCLYE